MYCNIFYFPHFLKDKWKKKTLKKLTLIDVVPAFIILLWSYFISVIVFAWEILSNKRIGKKKRKKNWNSGKKSMAATFK